MTEKKPTTEEIKRLRNKIRAAFASLRRQGIAARMNFECCSSCALSKAPKGKHFVYYHAQDHFYMQDTGKVDIRYAAMSADGHYGLAVQTVEALMRAGLAVVTKPGYEPKPWTPVDDLPEMDPELAAKIGLALGLDPSKSALVSIADGQHSETVRIPERK